VLFNPESSPNVAIPASRGKTIKWLRMNKVRFVFLAMLPVLIAACTTTRQAAPVLDRTSGVRAVEVPRISREADESGYYTVQKGDTLLQIALEFGQNYRDIVAWNNLANPNDIKVDQVLRVLPPDSGAQTGSVATSSGVEVRPLNSSAAAATGNKSGPNGEKRPYSEGALTELQKPEPPRSNTAQPPKPEPPKVAAKPPESSVTVVPNDENLSWVWPADGKVVAGFSESKRGIDIAGKLGQPVLAAGAGKVLYAGSGIRGYGNLVIVKHSNNMLSAYAHNKTIFVKEDQTVAQGQKIAEMGNSDADEVKLHFEIRKQGKPVDPSKFLPIR
jgi:lipoprotein NlpD